MSFEEDEMSKKTVVCVVGTRPEAIKMAPVVMALRSSKYFDTKVLATGQHSSMLDKALANFDIRADHNLSIMREQQTLDHITSAVLTGAGAYFDSVAPDAVLVHGDTTTTFSAALAAFYRKIPVGHVEAGLRSFDIYLPFPEEMNRLLTDRLVTWAFAPTEQAKRNLMREGMQEEMIHVTGNTVIDALLYTADSATKPATQELSKLPEHAPFILSTMHRRESWGSTLEGICSAIRRLLSENAELWFIVPMHKNPAVRESIRKILGDNERAILCDALDYRDFVWAMSASRFIMSDSGGVQEEASAIKKPVLILRDVTERPEAIEQGSGILVGVDRDKIYNAATELLTNKESLRLAENKCAAQPFGDGSAGMNIAGVIEAYFREADHKISEGAAW